MSWPVELRSPPQNCMPEVFLYKYMHTYTHQWTDNASIKNRITHNICRCGIVFTAVWVGWKTRNGRKNFLVSAHGHPGELVTLLFENVAWDPQPPSPLKARLSTLAGSSLPPLAKRAGFPNETGHAGAVWGSALISSPLWVTEWQTYVSSHNPSRKGGPWEASWGQLGFVCMCLFLLHDSNNYIRYSETWNHFQS